MPLAVPQRERDGGWPVRRIFDYRGGPEDQTARIGMVVFLASWAMLFASLFFSYALVRARAPAWPPPGEPPLPLGLPVLNTALVLASSGAVALALRALREGRPRRAPAALATATLLGAAFLALQAVVWARVHGEGLTPASGPYGSVFYALTVFHALHVAVGLVALGWLTVRAARGTVSATRHLAVRLWGMYWHFVAAVWVVLFASVYVL